ncbi:uncharacterized protein LOC111612702 [Centruroides sculpturatus]|uniref:uncharacterized protein LOC111612702 n=1 Tax=Centruroides sculpturatus TaxID=218467 RepID=UPI000C6D35E0|nr:uncharacterized protein LOC111612702 [Centruroides sculpturatus]
MDPFVSSTEEFHGLAATGEELQRACNAFETGMNCVDEYISRCISYEQRVLLDKKLAGARKVMATVCKEEKLLQGHRTYNCFRDLKNEFVQCSKPIHKIRQKRPYHSGDDTFRNLCCAQMKFLDCISTETRKICEEHAVSLVLKLIQEIWSPQLQQKCSLLSIICSSCTRICLNRLIISLNLIFIINDVKTYIL